MNRKKRVQYSSKLFWAGVVVWHWLGAIACLIYSITMLLSWTRKYDNVMGEEQGEITHWLSTWTKHTQLGEIMWVYYQSNQSRGMRNKIKSWNTFHPLLLSELNLILFLLSAAQGNGEWWFWLVHHMLPHPSHGEESGILKPFSCSSKGSLPQQTILQELLQCGLSP